MPLDPETGRYHMNPSWGRGAAKASKKNDQQADTSSPSSQDPVPADTQSHTTDQYGTSTAQITKNQDGSFSYSFGNDDGNAGQTGPVKHPHLGAALSALQDEWSRQDEDGTDRNPQHAREKDDESYAP